MRVTGSLITNSDIFFSVFIEDYPNYLEFAGEILMFLSKKPTGAVYSFTKVQANGEVWKLNTETEGEYEIEAAIPVEDQYGYAGTITDRALITIADAPANQITQTHTFVEANTDKCNKIGVRVDASQEFNEINGVSITSTTTHTLYKNRDEQISIEIVATDTQYGSNIKANTDTFPFMKDVYAEGNYMSVYITEAIAPNIYQYNFDGTWNTFNKYTYSTPGEKVIVVRDLYGCEKSILFTAIELPDVDPTNIDYAIYISKGNSLRMAERIEFDSSSNYKKDENTFGCEVDYLELNYFYKQRFKIQNLIKTQIKSSYENHVATLHNSLGATTDLPLTKVQSNLLYTDTRACNIVSDDVYMYIYFDDGIVPYFYLIGSYIKINGVSDKQILNIGYNEELGVYAIQVTSFIDPTLEIPVPTVDTPISQTSLNVTWPPTSDSDFYQVSIVRTGYQEEIVNVVLGTNYTKVGLSPGETVYFKVRGGVGSPASNPTYGLWSEQVSGTTPGIFKYKKSSNKISQFLSDPEAGTVEYVYNKQEYDVYEFEIDTSQLSEGEYYVTLEASATGEDTRYFQSNNFFLGYQFDETVDIMYYCDNNTDIYYGSQIKHFLTVGIEYRNGLSDITNEVINIDSTNYLKKSFNVEKFEYLFEPMTLEIARKLAYALCNQYVIINEVGYAFDSVEISVLNSNTNLYQIKATCSKTFRNLKFISGISQFTFSSSIVKWDSSIKFDATRYEIV